MGVTGIDGLFFRAADADMLAARDRDHLDVGAGCVADPAAAAAAAADEWSWVASGAPVVFAPFKADTD